MKLLKILSGLLLALGATLLVGFRVRPRQFSTPQRGVSRGSIPLPRTLPDPVRRYLRASVGEELPIVESALMQGRGKIRRGPLWMPLRYHVAHVPGHHFRRYMEVTWFGIPVVHGMDEYLDGRGATTIAGETVTGEEVNQAANLMLWAEAVCMPSLFVTDPRLRWEAINDHTARLIVPFGKGEDALTFYFSKETGLIERITALRHKTAVSGKLPWTVEFLDWEAMSGGTYPVRFSVTWGDEGKPWSFWNFETLDWNVDITPYLPEVRVPQPPRMAAAPATLQPA